MLPTGSAMVVNLAATIKEAGGVVVAAAVRTDDLTGSRLTPHATVPEVEAKVNGALSGVYVEPL